MADSTLRDQTAILNDLEALVKRLQEAEDFDELEHINKELAEIAGRLDKYEQAADAQQ